MRVTAVLVVVIALASSVPVFSQASEEDCHRNVQVNGWNGCLCFYYEPDKRHCVKVSPIWFEYSCVGGCADPGENCDWGAGHEWLQLEVAIAECEGVVAPDDACSDQAECWPVGVDEEYGYVAICRCQ